MAKILKSVKIYILLGYITLIMIASVTVWIIYNETLDLYDNQVDMNPVSERIFLANSILMNLYEAENLERNYLQTGNTEHYQSYNTLIDSISSQINLLGSIEGIPSQLMHTDSIQKLLTKKRENLKELNAIKNSASSEKLYERALFRLTQNKDSLNQLFKMYNTMKSGKDTASAKQRQARFFEQLITVFSPPSQDDTAKEGLGNASIQVDSIFNTFNPTDSVEQLMTSIIEEVRKESVAFEKQLMQKEQENLENAQIITLQIRQILTKLENEEILFSLNKVSTQQDHISRMTNIVIALGAAAILIIVGFLILILKDITRSQHYRQNLEKEKAYSESLLKSKEQLMLSITHDLKSPINSIAGFASLAGKEKSTERRTKYLRNIESSTNYISRLINDLLDFARLETGKMTIENHPVELNNLIEEVIAGFYPLAKEKNLKLNLITDIIGNIYLTDGTRINQILSNLVSNAIKFTNEGIVQVTAAVTKSKGKTDWIKFEVEDSGIGISNEHTNLIFEEFARISEDSSNHYEGTGLGLTITKRIVELLKGKIELTSNPGKGSCFSVTLPLQKHAAPVEKQTTSLANGHHTLFDKEHVLIVDDDPFLLELTAHILTEANMSVVSLTNGEEALTAINEQSFDLLITDVQMPGINGYDLLAYFKNSNGTKIPAIAVTGEANDKEHYLHAGFSSVLQKPFQPEELLHSVSGVLSDLNNNNNNNNNNNTNHQFAFDRPSVKTSVAYSIEGIKAFAAGDDDTVREILLSFAQSTAENLQVFKEQLQQKDVESMKKIAHKMLPMFRQLEVSEITEPLRALEQDSWAGRDTEWLDTCNNLALKIEQLMELIINEYQLPFSGKVIS